MIRVGVSGAAGRMGSVVTTVVLEADDMDLAGRYAPGHSAPEGFSDDPSSLAGCDVIVEVTRPDVVMENLRRWHDLDVDVVVGTSGFDAVRIDEVVRLWTGDRHCRIVPNFSIGAVLMMRFAASAAEHFAGAEVIELHHDGKIDAPSGTAIATARGIATARAISRSIGEPGGSDSEGPIPPGPARGYSIEGVRVHSIRLPGLLAHQEVILGGQGEVLTIRHDTMDRSAFGPGIALAIRSIGTQPEPVVVGLDDLV